MALATKGVDPILANSARKPPIWRPEPKIIEIGAVTPSRTPRTHTPTHTRASVAILAHHFGSRVAVAFCRDAIAGYFLARLGTVGSNQVQRQNAEGVDVAKVQQRGLDVGARA